MRNFTRTGLFLVIFLLIAPQAQAKRKKSYISATTMYNSFTDLKLSAGEEVKIKPALATELDFRVSRIFSFLISGSQSIDSLRSDYGLGIRVGLPGFFLLGGANKDFQRESKKYPLNTSIYFLSSLTTLRAENAPDTKTITSTYGFTIDLFLFNPIAYLSTHFSVYTLQGNSFLSLGAGLGAQF